MKGIPIIGRRDTEESARKAQGIVESIAKNTAAAICLDILGPMAKTFAEFMERQTALEDSLWYCSGPTCRAVTFGEKNGPCPACEKRLPRIQYRYVPKAGSIEGGTAEPLVDRRHPSDLDSPPPRSRSYYPGCNCSGVGCKGHSDPETNSPDGVTMAVTDGSEGEE